jgi:hypothetical protein
MNKGKLPKVYLKKLALNQVLSRKNNICLIKKINNTHNFYCKTKTSTISLFQIIKILGYTQKGKVQDV